MPPPYTNPRVQSGDFTYLGYFDVPSNDGAGTSLDFSQGGPAGIGPDNGANKTLIWSAIDNIEMSFVRVNIPASLVTSGANTATVVNTSIQLPNRNGMWSDPTKVDPNKKIGAGAFYYNGRYIFSGYPYYDGGGYQDRSHWATSSWAAPAGPYQVGPTYNPPTEYYRAGIAGGYMGTIPTEWEAIFGGPALTGIGAIAIIGRSSYGPAAAVFDPDDLGVTAPAPATPLVYYPDAHQTAGTFDSPSGPYPTPNYFTGADAVRGVAFPDGSSSVLFFGRHGLRGPTSSPAFFNGCRYGKGTSVLANDNTVSDEPPNIWVYDPSDGGKGPHSYPYMLTCWAYAAEDLLEVKAGTLEPWEVFPYAMFDFAPGGPLSSNSANILGATFDVRDNRLYISGFGRRVHVYTITPSGPAGSASLSPSASASSSPSPSIAPLDGIAWGEQTPAAGEEAVTFRRWQTAAGVEVVITGDTDWGTLSLPNTDTAYGPVIDTGDTVAKTFTAQTNKYGTGTGSTTMSIRGGASPWSQHANEIAGPVWVPYTGPTMQTWRYVQLRLVTP